ncbi:MAG: YihY/virulence factor BrkB family protein [Verrucomicrobiaceae bacterium]|nr:MAG: YihY/virulence factor BrkB family protein [Verrucomicrobiaceae bacterium]
MKEAERRSFTQIPQRLRHSGAVVWRALIKYDETDGEQRAASFAYYAFFSLFPLILLLITAGSKLLGDSPSDQEWAAHEIIGYVGNFIPIGATEANVVIDTINGVAQSRRSAGIISLAALAWSALRFFQALVHGVNKAWGTKEYQWWRLPIQNFLMCAILASALFLGIFAPFVVEQAERFYWQNSRTVGLEFGWMHYIFQTFRLLVPPLVLFYGFSMFYKFAPRRRTKFREVWTAALVVTLLLTVLKSLFLLYTSSIGDFNRLYGAFGSVVALLMWIYLSGSVIILGGCLSAAQYEIGMHISDQSEASAI